MKRLLFIIDSRSSFIKAISIYDALKQDFEIHLLHIGKYFNTIKYDILYNQLNFPLPDTYLSIDSKPESGDFYNSLYINNDEYLNDKYTLIDELLKYDWKKMGILGEICNKLKVEFKNIKPDAIILFGCATGALSGSLVARMLTIEIIHIDGGLHSGDLQTTEEVNSILLDHMSTYHFVTDRVGLYNLKLLGITHNVYIIGNIMIDTQHKYLQQSYNTEYHNILGIKSKEYALIILHKPTNINNSNKLKEIINELDELSKRDTLILQIYPETKANLVKNNLFKKINENPNIIIIESLCYLEFTCLLANCKYLITDSSGLQDESSELNIPCFILGKYTEGQSILIKNNGTNQLITRINDIKNLHYKNKTFKSIIINIIGNNIVGTGHIKRQEQIINIYKSHYKIIIVTQDIDVNNYFNDYNNTFCFIYKNLHELLNIILKENPVLFINDSLNSEKECMRKIKQYCPKILSYEDAGLGTIYANIVINELYSEHSMKILNNELVIDKKFYCGIQNFSIRKEFYSYIPTDLKNKPKNILITFGGTDPLNYTELILQFVCKFEINNKYVIFVVLGLGYNNKVNIINKYNNINNINLIEHVTNFPEIMHKCDIAFSSQGRTACELIYMNIPTMCFAQNIREILHDYCSEENGIYNIGMLKDLRNDHDMIYIKECFTEFINKYEILYCNMKKNKCKIDNGFTNNITIINNLLTSNNSHNISNILINCLST
jgi:UDP-N-acetylglucosamine 2-epimerase